MLVGGFRELWNRAVFSVGLGWLVLIALVWQSGHLSDASEQLVFIVVLLAGFLATYGLGFAIEARFKRKRAEQS
ncbi:hypothetical protein [Prosthecochloris sp. CIB 2401]|uniref:hypothetical protein n=1 Tax=Prosthecochloris sp. CIB 2401 TaxID=1868325 RepID=UPI00080AACF2|nr:hypothetical protein [Prosthecochloris sp. CIB 2401]ANT64023.1 hypothetical protein Ptc2401_00215 [Prosthecochloris sp. CIB 2401]